jgi:hypothetical protein
VCEWESRSGWGSGRDETRRITVLCFPSLIGPWSMREGAGYEDHEQRLRTSRRTGRRRGRRRRVVDVVCKDLNLFSARSSSLVERASTELVSIFPTTGCHSGSRGERIGLNFSTRKGWDVKRVPSQREARVEEPVDPGALPRVPTTP